MYISRYPWGEEAINKAKAEDKPIFLSIGYSTCHWCHVMERESFENEEIAEILNKYYISIKVDREERPDVDRVYMTFVQVSFVSKESMLHCGYLSLLQSFFLSLSFSLTFSSALPAKSYNKFLRSQLMWLVYSFTILTPKISLNLNPTLPLYYY